MNSRIIIGIIIVIISIGVAIVLSADLSVSPDISNPADIDSGNVISRTLDDTVISDDSP